MYFSDYISKLFKRYIIETVLLSIGIIIVIFSVGILISSETKKKETHVEITERKTKVSTPSTLVIDVSGAVENPDVYILPSGSTIKDAIEAAGGLSYQADTFFIARNYNLALPLVQLQKIHLPSIPEIETGVFYEEKRLLSYLQQTEDNRASNQEDIDLALNTDKTNINTASKEQLVSLPEIGDKTAEKIIQNRPFTNGDDLVNKKVISSSAYQKIADYIIF